MKQNRQSSIATEYILDELLALLKPRESHRVATAADKLLLTGQAARLESIGVEELTSAWEVFRELDDKAWSFTDCTNEVVIERLGIYEAFTLDHHFDQFGTVSKVPN